MKWVRCLRSEKLSLWKPLEKILINTKTLNYILEDIWSKETALLKKKASFISPHPACPRNPTCPRPIDLRIQLVIPGVIDYATGRRMIAFWYPKAVYFAFKINTKRSVNWFFASMKNKILLPESKYLPRTTFKREKCKLVVVWFQDIDADECSTKKTQRMITRKHLKTV